VDVSLPRLVGRNAELAELKASLVRAADGGPDLLLLTGQEGVGKTALLDALVALHEGPVWRARAASWESDRRHGVLDQILPPGGRSAEAFSPEQVAASLTAHAGDSSGRHLHLLVVDDAHDADAESLQVLSTIVRHRLLDGLVVVLAARDGVAAARIDDLLHRVSSRVVHLEPLEPDAVGSLAASRGRPLPRWASIRLCRHTGGRPRHVLALLDEIPPQAWDVLDLRLPPPASVSVSVSERLRSASPDAQALIDAVAVLAHPSTLEEAGRLAELCDVLEPLDEASRIGLVIRSGGRLGPFVGPADPMIRAAVLDAMGPHRAAVLRRRAAEVVVEPARALGFLAAATVGRDDALADRLEARADLEARNGSWRTVADLLTDASRLTTVREHRESRLVRAVDALVGAGDGAAAAALAPVLESFRDTPLRNSVLAYLAIILGRATEAGNRLDRAWQDLGREQDPEVAALVCQRQVLHALARCQGPELVTWADRAADLVGPAAAAAVEAAAIRGLGVAASGRSDEAVELYRTVALQVHQGPQQQRIALGRGWTHLVRDEFDEARGMLESAVPTTLLGGSSRITLWALGWLARLRFLTGDWDLALQAVEQGQALAQRTGIELITPLIAWTGAQVAALRGDSEGAWSAVRTAEARPQEYALMRLPCMLARAEVLEVQHDHDAVLRTLGPLADLSAGTTVDEPGWWPWQDVYGHALLQAGRLEDADAFLRKHERLASARGARATSARLCGVRARWHDAVGHDAEARRCFDEGLHLLDELPLRYDRARMNFIYGRTLRRAGKRRDADSRLSAARDVFVTLDATVEVARCDRELAAGGMSAARGERPTTLTMLTAQERAVSVLVARGLSNREVAAELHVSHKTVQYHLTRVYAKFGIRTRSELAARTAHEGRDT
jgi:DNA-binding CsgD family transcriptional regulator